MARDADDGKVCRTNCMHLWLVLGVQQSSNAFLNQYPPLDPPPLLHNVHLNASKPQRLEVDERAVFLRFELFAKRLGKLCDMFTSIDQISGLEQHTHITGGSLTRPCLKSGEAVWDAQGARQAAAHAACSDLLPQRPRASINPHRTLAYEQTLNAECRP
jgi:hypothetical protein